MCRPPWIRPSRGTLVTRLSPRYAAGYCVFPMTAVELSDGERSDIHIFQASHIDVDLIGIRARNVKWMDAAAGAKRVLCNAGIEAIGRQRILAADELERILRHDEMQKTLFAADRAVALRHPRQIRGHAKAHAPTMAAALISLQRELSAVMAGANLLHLAIAEQPELRRIAGRLGQTEMAERVRGD